MRRKSGERGDDAVLAGLGTSRYRVRRSSAGAVLPVGACDASDAESMGIAAGELPLPTTVAGRAAAPDSQFDMN